MPPSDPDVLARVYRRSAAIRRRRRRVRSAVTAVALVAVGLPAATLVSGRDDGASRVRITDRPGEAPGQGSGTGEPADGTPREGDATGTSPMPGSVGRSDPRGPGGSGAVGASGGSEGGPAGGAQAARDQETSGGEETAKAAPEGAVNRDGLVVHVRTAGGDEDLWVSRLDGSDARPLTSGPAVDTEPVWAPDGKTVAFTRATSANGQDADPEIWLVDVAGGAPRRVLPAPAFSAAWSPDGRQLAFSATVDGADEVFVANADGTGRRALTDLPAGHAHAADPSWSPDGSRIAFWTESEEVGGSCAGTVDADAVAVCSDVRTVEVATGQVRTVARGISPAWAPDGTIAYVRNDDGAAVVRTVAPDGSDRVLTRGLPAYSQLAWSRAGQSLTFVVPAREAGTCQRSGGLSTACTGDMYALSLQDPRPRRIGHGGDPHLDRG